MFPDAWSQNGRPPQPTWYGVSRSMPNVATIARLAASHPDAARVVTGVGTFVGPVTRAGHPTTWAHHGLTDTHGHGGTYWWCISQQPGGVGVGQRLWGSHARILEVVAGWRTPRSRTALVRVAD